MLHILLLILKIIGILLAVVLGVIVLGICLALFVPVRYRVEAKRTEGGDNPPIEVRAGITWLFHLVNIRVRYPAEVYVRARIFLFTVFRLPQKPKKKKKRRGKKSRPAADERIGGKSEETSGSEEEPGGETAKESGKEPGEKSEGRSGVASERESGKEPGEKAEEREEGTYRKEPEEKAGERSEGADRKEPDENSREKAKDDRKKRSVMEWIKEKLWQIRQIFQNIWYTIKGICDRIKTIWENMEYYRGVLQSDTFKEAFSLCKEELLSVFSSVKPDKFQAELTVGRDDPAVTGKILSYYGILYPLVGNHVTVVPDFERKRIEGNVSIRGKIRLFMFLKAAVRIYFNKNIRKLLRLFKKEEI